MDDVQLMYKDSKVNNKYSIGWAWRVNFKTIKAKIHKDYNWGVYEWLSQICVRVFHIEARKKVCNALHHEHIQVDEGKNQLGK